MYCFMYSFIHCSSNGHLLEKVSKFDCHDNSSVLLIDNLSSLLLVYTCPEVCRLVHLLSKLVIDVTYNIVFEIMCLSI